MDFLLFNVLGILDIIALYAFMFKSFRLPFVEYIKEISLISIVVSLVSYIVRIYFDSSPLIDVIIHLFLYIAFFRYLIKIKTHKAVVISLIYLGYGGLSFLIYFVYVHFNIFSPESIDQSTGIAAYAIQLTRIVITCIIAWILFRFNLGSSRFIRPPHDFIAKSKIKKSDMIALISTIITTIVFMFSFFWMLNFRSFLMIPVSLLSFVALIWIIYKRDNDDERSNRSISL